ncbi:predicted protein [Thalassiosira pseudonana CCMP1335]|uniref:Uncharacterized protein n=1 Tax=Thalassiosira pseudonana TaxID=35128 RepID=B8CFG1_THAPS|nr:predicted protein [Thalassiosira pseudonana CCMP1335]EED87623.1 predicted protein [Thalassiosira pseudonana CCMP1335]
MGDITIHLLLDSSLRGSDSPFDNAEAGSDKLDTTLSSSHASFNPSAANEADDYFAFDSASRVISADASLADMMDYIISILSSDNNTAKCKVLSRLSIIDISYHPPKVITDTIRQFNEYSGPKSKTLIRMGWFPSGKLVVLRSPPLGIEGGAKAENTEERLLERFVEWQSRNVLQHEETVYNTAEAKSKGNRSTERAGDGVQWVGTGAKTTAQKLKPTDIFSAVEQRFDQDDTLLQQQQQQTTKAKSKRRTEQQRTQRLDSILRNLKQSKMSKNKKVSHQVRTMLLKSRSEGNKKLRMEDRFHLEVVRLEDCTDISGGATEYRFFSRQTTAGKVASTMTPSLGSAKAAEFLVSCSAKSTTSDDVRETTNNRYRRLPNTMSLHDAQEAGWIEEFDVVMIRIYSLHKGDGEGYGQSKSVLDPDSEEEKEGEEKEGGLAVAEMELDVVNATSEIEMGGVSSSTEHQPTVAETSNANEIDTEQSTQLQLRLHAIFNADDNSDKPMKKKKKGSKQVQNMLIKSKASGNALIKQEDRVYLDVVVFHGDGHDNEITSSYRFFTKQTAVQQVVSVCTSDTDGGSDDKEIEFIVQQSVNNTKIVYRRLPPTITMGDAMQKKLVQCFDRVLIRVYDTKGGCVPCESIGGVYVS